MIELISPNGQEVFSGLYQLCAEKANGHWVWERSDGNCLYSGMNGRWYVATKFVKEKAEDNKKVLENEISDLETAIDSAKESIMTLKTEIEALDDGIRALDKEVSEYTEQRKEDHDEFVAVLSANTAAVDLLKFAKNRLNKFYNPSQYKEPAASAAFFAQIRGSVHRKDGVAPPKLPDMPEYKPAGGSGGILGLMDQITHELQMDAKEAEMEEQQAQKDYVQLMQQSQVSRAADLKAITDLQNSRAVLEEKINEAKESRKMAYDELDIAHKYTSELHSTCDFVVENFDLRTAARKNELESLKNAKTVMQTTD